MRSLPLRLAGLVLAGSLILPATQVTHAASASPGTQRGTAPLSLSAIAAVEGVTPQVLQQDLQAGQTLLQIAVTAHSPYSSSAQTLATALLAPRKARLDQAVTAGRITQAQETQRYDALLSRVTTLVTTSHPQLRLGWSGNGGPKGHAGTAGHGPRGYGMLTRGPLLTTLATACQTTTTALKTAIHTGGKSVLAICQSTNSSIQEADLANTLLAAYKTRLDARVTAGHLTTSQESQLLTAMQSRIGTLITTPLPAGTATPTA